MPDPKSADASLSPGEVATLALFARFSRFASERDFYRYADANLRSAFPALPDRSQFNRLARSHAELIEEMALHLAKMMETRACPYEALDSAVMVVRDAKRRGSGWRAGYADVGWSNRLGWYEGFKLLAAVLPQLRYGARAVMDERVLKGLPHGKCKTRFVRLLKLC